MSTIDEKIERLRREGRTIMDIADEVNMDQSTVSGKLKRLGLVGLIPEVGPRAGLVKLSDGDRAVLRRASTGDAERTDLGYSYTARFLRLGLIEPADNRPTRRVYRLTEAGRRELATKRGPR